MALKITFKETVFGVGDKVRVVQKIKEEGGKSHEANFEGMVIGIKGRDMSKTFMVRKVAEGGIGVERIFPLALTTIDRIILVKPGMRGVKRAKLYFTREKAPTEIEMIYKRAAIKTASKTATMKSASNKKRTTKKRNKPARKKS